MLNYIPKQRYTLFITNRYGRVIGRISVDTLVMDAWACKCTHPLGWAISKALIEKSAKAGITIIEINDRQEHRVYSVPITRFLRFGKYLNKRANDKLCLSLSYWDTSDGFSPLI
jgi:hypothetical protein